MNPANYSVLTPQEIQELIALASRWEEAHTNKDFARADALRLELMEWGAWPPENGWHPVFESRPHRIARIDARTPSQR